jgi:hypothetical protein
MANEVFVTCIQLIAPGDEKYAISFAVPINAKGIENPVAKTQAAALSVFGQPVRRERRGALFRRREGPVGPDVHRSGHRDVPEPVPRHPGACVPELPGNDPPVSQAALPELYKFAWDAVGSDFASRHAQYEMFFAGATFVTKGHAVRSFDWTGAATLPDNMLSSYDLIDEAANRSAAAG